MYYYCGKSQQIRQEFFVPRFLCRQTFEAYIRKKSRKIFRILKEKYMKEKSFLRFPPTFESDWIILDFREHYFLSEKYIKIYPILIYPTQSQLTKSRVQPPNET